MFYSNSFSKKRFSKNPATQSKKTKKSGKVFGAQLNNYQLARIQPLVITIRDRIESEGIFRKPGSRARQKVRNKLFRITFKIDQILMEHM